MNNISSCQFYCLSYNNEDKKNSMIKRFTKFKIECKFYSGIYDNDKRVKMAKNKLIRRQWSIFYGHLDILFDFINNTNKKFAIICEDDIYIHKNIKLFLSKIIADFNLLGLDILLLGYLLPYKLDLNNACFNYKLKRDMPENSIFKYHDYPEYLSGCQMYLISRDHAQTILDKYYNNFSKFIYKPFIIDKLLLKEGNKALIYPMISIENDQQEDPYHKLCHLIHYNEFYI